MFGQNYHSRMAQRPSRSKGNSGERQSAPSAAVPLKVPYWSRFRNPAKVDAQKIRDLFALNVVNLTAPGGASHLEQIQVIATQATTPIPIAYLDPVLAKTKSIRGTVFFRNLGPILNEIAIGYRDMIWFLSAEGFSAVFTSESWRCFVRARSYSTTKDCCWHVFGSLYVGRRAGPSIHKVSQKLPSQLELP